MIEIPDGYELATPAPKKGDRCSTCRFLGKGGDRCANKDYVEAAGTDKFLYRGKEYKAKRFCCMLWKEDLG